MKSVIPSLTDTFLVMERVSYPVLPVYFFNFRQRIHMDQRLWCCTGIFPQYPAAALAWTANENGGCVILGRFSGAIYYKLCSIVQFRDVYSYFVLHRWRSWRAVAFRFFVKTKNTKTSGVCITRLCSSAKTANANK